MTSVNEDTSGSSVNCNVTSIWSQSFSKLIQEFSHHFQIELVHFHYYYYYHYYEALNCHTNHETFVTPESDVNTRCALGSNVIILYEQIRKQAWLQFVCMKWTDFVQIMLVRLQLINLLYNLSRLQLRWRRPAIPAKKK